jgi:hypothetical protein
MTDDILPIIRFGTVKNNIYDLYIFYVFLIIVFIQKTI